MARASGTSVENNFVKGFLTEYSGFNFPENACEEALNCVFEYSGRVKRRYGLALEGLSSNTFNYTQNSIYNSFIWNSAGFRSENTFLVLQIDNLLHFFKVGTGDIANEKMPFVVNLDSYATLSTPGKFYCQFTNGSGRLFVVNPHTETLYVTFNSDTQNIEVNTLKVFTRDFKVQQDGFSTTQEVERGFENDLFLYNLYNQGWTEDLLSKWFNAGNTKYPTKAQVWWYFRDASGPNGIQFTPSLRYKFQDLGFSLAPRGKFLFDTFNQDRNGISGLTGLSTTSSRGKRPSCISFLNGRVFLSGVDADSYNGVVYFSNILRDVSTDIRFYQNGEPSSEVNAQLLSNDGGTFTIPEAGKILKMLSVKNALIIFATNGVWAVQGSQGMGFTATDFSIEKVSDDPCIDNNSFTTVSSFPIWWTQENIFSLESSNTGNLKTTQISLKTIQKFYNKIPLLNKNHVKVAYNTLTNEIFWLYSSILNQPTSYNRVLVLNLQTQGFYVHSLPLDVKIVDIVAPPVLVNKEETTAVVNNSGAEVTNNSGELVESLELVAFDYNNLLNVRFIVEYDSDKLGFGYFQNADNKDWPDLVEGGLDFSSFFVTGPRLRGEGQRKFQENYITVYSEPETNASCFVFPIWDYGNNAESNRYGTKQQVMVSSEYRDYSTRRLKIRGSGKSVKYRFESEENKPFTILGWVAYETVDPNV